MTVPATLKVENPYWDEISDFVYGEQWSWGTEWYVDPMRDPKTGEYRKLDDQTERDLILSKTRHPMVKKYSWTIPDPATLAFVVEHVRDNMVVDPLAGTGYWAYLLQQHGIITVAADEKPGTNAWHRDSPLWVPVFEDDAVQTVEQHQNKTLLLSWVPYGSEIGIRTVRAYQGNRIIYIGEHSGDCCAEDSLFDEFDEHWDEVKSHRPIQWFGMHDYVSVYDRKAITDGR